MDIDFGIEEGVDFIGVSFVKSAEVINHLKSYISARGHERQVYFFHFDLLNFGLLFTILLWN